MLKNIIRRRATILLALSLFAANGSFAQDATPSPEGAMAQILSPQNGATVQSPFTVQFGLSGMGVAPAGTNVPNTGHHHLIIDADLPDPSLPVPADDNHIHFGKGQTQTTLELAPGIHTLQLLLGDWKHVPHTGVVTSEQITITVE